MNSRTPKEPAARPVRATGRHLRAPLAAQGGASRGLVLGGALCAALVAVALGLYLGQAAAARRSATQQLWNAAHAALTDAHLAAVMTGQTGRAGTVTLDHQQVTLAFGYPTADRSGIEAAVATTYVARAPDVPFAWAAAPSTPPTYLFGIAQHAGCTFTYTEATPAAPAHFSEPTGC